MQNSDFWIRIASLYVSQPSFVAFACTTATLGPVLQSSMGPRPLLCFFAFKTASFGSKLQVSMGPRPHLCFFSFKTASLAPDLKVSMGPCPHPWFSLATQRLLDQHCKSLWVSHLTYGFLHSKQRL